ncbi:MAG: GGDEF domain-containing protein [Oliverpabstia sp.]
MNRFIDYITRELFYAGMSQEEYKLIQNDVQEENRKSLLTFSAITVVFLFIMFFVSFVSEDVEANRWVYLFVMIVTAAMFAVAYLNKHGNYAVLLLDIYAFVILLFSFGIVLGTVTRPDEQTVTFVALLLTVPLLFTDRPIRMVICIFIAIISFIITAIFVKEDYVLVADIIDVTVFGTISAVVCTYMMSLKCQRFLYARKVSILSETDLLTGLCNRNSYEQKLETYSSMYNQVLSCIYVDVNGLHEMNNRRGHAAGDKMLQFVGKTLQKEFGERNSFRIGGDEFVVLVTDEKEEVIQAKIDHIQILVEEESYHVSIGYSVGNTSETDISLLIDTAEKRMYEAKQFFYQQRGVGRSARK